MKLICIAALLISSVCMAQSEHDLASQVSPFIGTTVSRTDADRNSVPGADQYGNTLPGAVRPFGMLYWSPDYVDVNSGTRISFIDLRTPSLEEDSA